MRFLFSLFVIFLHVLLSNSCKLGAGEERYIVGGHGAKEGEFPYMVSIQLNEHHHCGGSIIADRWILSAAHCFVRDNDPSEFTILAGTVNLEWEGQRYSVKNIISHPTYVNYTDDVALLELEEDISFDSTIDKVNLPTQNTPGDTEVVLTGWGLTDFNPNIFTDTLKAVSLLTISNKECREYYGSKIIPDGDICTLTEEGEGSCQGDSGGPLVDPKRNRQVGIVSGGIPCATGSPDIFTRVYSYLDWINKEMNVRVPNRGKLRITRT